MIKKFFKNNLLLMFSVLSFGLAINNSCVNAESNDKNSENAKNITNQLKALSKTVKVDFNDLQNAANSAVMQQSIIDAITKPWEAKPWYKYEALFITPERISKGAEFFLENEKIFINAEKKYGVNKEIIAAILGVETYYGTKMGNHRILDALYTLGFYYPKRSEYFSKEFANFVKLAKEQNWDVTEKLGSYAGAMGMGQFMPSSYLYYAVDFDGDGYRDLFNNKFDAIGSIANYFAKSKWTLGKPVAYKVTVPHREKVAKLINNKLELNTTWKNLVNLGVTLEDPLVIVGQDQKVKLLELDSGEKSKDYYIVFPNFISITRYNRSPLYAMAVYELSMGIKSAVEQAKK